MRRQSGLVHGGKLLLRNSSDASKEDAALDLSLSFAIEEGHEAIATQLIKAKVKVNKITGREKINVLSLAVDREDKWVVRFLIQGGAEVTPDWPGPGRSTFLGAAVTAGPPTAELAWSA